MKPTGEIKPNTYKDGSVVTDKEPGLPVNIPLSWLRWLIYSAGFACLLAPFNCTIWQLVCGGLILGHFASQLNALIKK